MSDLISRQAALKVACDTCQFVSCPDDDKCDEYEAMKNLPSAQPERKTGRWINAYPDIESNPMFMYGICSECGFEQSISDKLNFCPNCGADMRGEPDD